MKQHPIHTSNNRHAEHIWLLLGGKVLPVRRTGEKFYTHEFFEAPLRLNGRRDDVPAKLLSRINQAIKLKAANDDSWRLR